MGPHVVERERATDGAHDGATEGFERVRHERCVKRDAVWQPGAARGAFSMLCEGVRL